MVQFSQKKDLPHVANFDVFDRLPQARTASIQAGVVKPSRSAEIASQAPSHQEVVADAVPVAEDPSEVTSEYTSNAELYFERETAVPDFEREAVYDVDSFEKKSSRAEKLLAPPPDFQKSLKTLSPDLQKKFKDLLNGDIVGIWPIKQDFLLK